MTMINSDHRVRGPVTLLLRVVAAAGLVVDGYVHFELAAGYDAVGSTITQGTLFRVQGVIAILAAVLILLMGRAWVYLAAFLVAASALVAVVASAYIDLGSFGPLPNMYEPVWYPDKTNSAIGEAVAAAAALGLLALTTLRRRTPARAPSSV
ncbi:MAG: hypothetical protein ACRDTC_08090 [Pseudonocardiaceae bacterium]